MLWTWQRALRSMGLALGICIPMFTPKCRCTYFYHNRNAQHLWDYGSFQGDDWNVGLSMDKIAFLILFFILIVCFYDICIGEGPRYLWSWLSISTPKSRRAYFCHHKNAWYFWGSSSFQRDRWSLGLSLVKHSYQNTIVHFCNYKRTPKSNWETEKW